ncbi:MAG: hypothetical protein Q4D23_08175 [Bacteroidales bacterium]|nr:hypothetical protein [Bacteroidales bacterium]
MRNLTKTLLAILFAAPLTIAAQRTTTIYAEDFSNEEAFARYTTLNTNEDEFTWEYDRERGALSCERYFDMAWDALLLPPLNLVKGREYTFSFDVQVVGDDDFTDNFESITVYTKIKTNTTSGFSEPGELLGTDFEVIPESATPTRRTYTFVSKYNETAYFTIEHNTCLEVFGEALRPYGKLIVDNISVTEFDPDAPVVPEVIPAKPLAVETPSLCYDYESATATLTWNPVVEDENGNALTAADVTYTVRRRGDSAPLAMGLTTCSFTDVVAFDEVNATASFGQKRLQYYVTATNAQGDSPSTLSQIRALGQPDALPFIESFANDSYSHFWTESHTGHGRWTAMDASDRYTQDADGGLYSFSAQEDGESSTAYSALINMENATKPVLTFYVYYVFPSGELNLLVSADGGEYRQAWTYDSNRDAAKEWVKVEVPLTDYNAAHTLQFAFDASEFAVASLVYIDNISLQSSIAHDLDISLVSAPRNLTVGEKRTMKVKVTNRGTQNVSGNDYDVHALAYWPIASAKGIDVEAGKSVIITLSGLQADGHFDTSVTLAARVEYLEDEYHSNDCTSPITLPVKHSLYPAPNDVKAEVTSAGVVLTWSAPDAPRSVSTPLTDSFEDYEDFTITNAGEWTFYQGVEGNVYSLEGISFPNAGHPQAWTVFNPAEAGLTNRPAHNGDKYLAAFSHPYVTEDSWFISERLGGISQQISLWARAFDTYTETFKVSYSTEDMEPESFVDLDNSTTTVTQEWKEYTFDLPEGTKYFAVRATSHDALALLVDDVTYVPATQAAQDIKLVGYNIYRDRYLVATCPADALTMTDTPDPDYHTYRIAAVWDKGESALTPHLDVDTRKIDSLGTVVADPATSNAVSYDLSGRRASSSTRIYIRGGRKVQQ